MDLKTQSANKAVVKGRLVSKDVRTGPTKDGKKTYIGGSLTVRVTQTYNGNTEISEIPVRFFSCDKKNDGSPNKMYENLVDLVDSLIPLSAAMSEDEADYIVLNRGDLSERYFPTRDGGALVNTFEVNGSFINKAKALKDDEQEQATFELTGVIKSIVEEVKNDEPTGRLVLELAIVRYGEKVDVLKFYVESQNAIDTIQDNWNKGDTVKVSGRIRMTSITQSNVKESADTFGEVIPDVQVTYRTELIITGGHPTPLDEDQAYDLEAISKGLAKRKADMDQALLDAKEGKGTAKKGAAEKAAPAASLADFD